MRETPAIQAFQRKRTHRVKVVPAARVQWGMNTPRITAARASEILTILRGTWSGKTREYRGEDGRHHVEGITDQEDTEIRAYWDTLSGDTSYADAVLRMSRGG